MTTCGGCASSYGGHRTEHCPAPGCHQTFTGTTAGEMHRAGHHGVTEGPDRRRCLSVEEMTGHGMELNGHGYWTTGEKMPESVWGQGRGNARD